MISHRLTTHTARSSAASAGQANVHYYTSTRIVGAATSSQVSPDPTRPDPTRPQEKGRPEGRPKFREKYSRLHYAHFLVSIFWTMLSG
jgi:hypothetical protein